MVSCRRSMYVPLTSRTISFSRLLFSSTDAVRIAVTVNPVHVLWETLSTVVP